MLLVVLILLAILIAAWFCIFGVIKIAALVLGLVFNVAIVHVIWFVFVIAFIGVAVTRDDKE